MAWTVDLDDGRPKTVTTVRPDILVLGRSTRGRVSPSHPPGIPRYPELLPVHGTRQILSSPSSWSTLLLIIFDEFTPTGTIAETQKGIGRFANTTCFAPHLLSFRPAQAGHSGTMSLWLSMLLTATAVCQKQMAR